MSPEPEHLPFPESLERVDWFSVIVALRLRDAEEKRVQRQWERNEAPSPEPK